MPAYADLVREYHGLVFKVALGVLRDPASAEDVTQDVFLGFLQNPAALARAENLKAFVCRSALNRALDARKAGARRAVRESKAPERRAEMDPVEAAFRREVRETVAGLPEEQRAAVDLRYFQGLTLREAAIALEVPEGTVSSRIGAALAKLRSALGAAAFAGMLAMLESELGKCAAAEAVPAGLPERLLRLSPGRGVPAARRAIPAAAVAAFLAAVTLVGFGVAKWRSASNPPAPSEPAGAALAAAPRAAAPSETDGGPSPAGAPPPAASETAATPAGETFVMEGFLYRMAYGLSLEEAVMGGQGPAKQTMAPQTDDGYAKDRIAEAVPYFADESALAGLPVAYPTFGPFLAGHCGADEAPRARLKVRVRAAGAEGAGRPVAIVEILEKEILSAAWLEAWRDMVGAHNELTGAWKMEPGLKKRAAVLEQAGILAGAVERARAARAGEACVRWRVARETEALSPARSMLEPIGLARVLPEWPAAPELHDILMAASTPQALRLDIVSRWGEDALALEAWCYREVGPGHIQVQGVPLAEACAMSPGDFTKLKSELDAIGDNHPRAAPAEEHPTYEAHRARTAARGLTLADLDPIDREHFILECGARVTAVAAGSAAERAGIRVGDVLWRATVPVRGKGEERTEPVIVWNAVNFGYLLGCADEKGMETVEVEVVREEGVVKVGLGK